MNIPTKYIESVCTEQDTDSIGILGSYRSVRGSNVASSESETTSVPYSVSVLAAVTSSPSFAVVRSTVSPQ